MASPGFLVTANLTAAAHHDPLAALQCENEDLKFIISNAPKTIINTADNALAKVLAAVGSAVAGLKADFGARGYAEALNPLAEMATKSTRAVGIAREELAVVRAGLDGVGLMVGESKEDAACVDVEIFGAEKRKWGSSEVGDSDPNLRARKRKARLMRGKLEGEEVLAETGSDGGAGPGLLDPRARERDIDTQTPAKLPIKQVPQEEDEGLIGLPRNIEKWLQQTVELLPLNQSGKNNYMSIEAGRPLVGLAAMQFPPRPVEMRQESNPKPIPTLGKKWKSAFAKHTMTNNEKRWVISMFEFRDMDDRNQWIEEMLASYRKCAGVGAVETVMDLERRLKALKALKARKGAKKHA